MERRQALGGKQGAVDMKKAIEMTAFDDSVCAVLQALAVFHPVLSSLDLRFDPEQCLGKQT